MDACPLNDIIIMGGETVFDLKIQLEKWRWQLASNEAYQESDINELESHLMEEVDNLKNKDLSEEESFLLSKHRLGDTQTLNVEFSKVNQTLIWRKRILLLLLGYFLFTTIAKVVNLVAIPFHLFDVQWFLFETPIFGQNFSHPLPLFLFILFIIGGILFSITSQKNIFKNNKIYHFNLLSRIEMGYKFILGFLVVYLIITFGNLLSTIFISHKFNAVTMGNISLSGSLFSILWNIFLFVSLLIISFVLLKERKESINA